MSRYLRSGLYDRDHQCTSLKETWDRNRVVIVKEGSKVTQSVLGEYIEPVGKNSWRYKPDLGRDVVCAQEPLKALIVGIGVEHNQITRFGTRHDGAIEIVVF